MPGTVQRPAQVLPLCPPQLTAGESLSICSPAHLVTKLAPKGSVTLPDDHVVWGPVPGVCLLGALLEMTPWRQSSWKQSLRQGL